MRGAPREAKDPGWRDRFAWVSGTKWERVGNRDNLDTVSKI